MVIAARCVSSIGVSSSSRSLVVVGLPSYLPKEMVGDVEVVMIPAEARAWVAENVRQPIIDFDEDGRRVVVEAPLVISVRRGWCENHYGLSAMWQDDGTLWLDSAGEHRYAKVRDLPGGTAAYQRVQDVISTL